jgi:16S rRNA (uracil1498-N3)-methyltransferase
MPRIFVAQEQFPDITGSDVHYVRDVLRMKVRDKLELLDGTGMVYEAEIKEIKKEKIVCEIVESGNSKVESRTQITLAQALPKASKMDFVIEKCVELGVHRIIPVLTERTVGKNAKLDRWRKLAKEAAEQSGRTIIPEIAELTDFSSVLKMKGRYDLALLPWELEKERTLKQSLKSLLLPQFPQILVLIGPEGGFSQAEVKQAQATGWQTVSLGKRILRTETAGMAVLSTIMYELE